MLLTHVGFAVLGFILGSIPITYYLGKLFADKDITLIPVLNDNGIVVDYFDLTGGNGPFIIILENSASVANCQFEAA